jgi:hypothetical protein
MLESVKTILGITDTSKDDILNLYIYLVQDEILNYCGIDSIPDGLQSIADYMTICKYNQVGAEGLSSASYSGVNETYLNSYSPSVIQSLNRYRKAKFI